MIPRRPAGYGLFPIRKSRRPWPPWRFLSTAVGIKPARFIREMPAHYRMELYNQEHPEGKMDLMVFKKRESYVQARIPFEQRQQLEHYARIKKITLTTAIVHLLDCALKSEKEIHDSRLDPWR